MSDEAWFQLSGFVNVQNTRYWVTENRHTIHKSPTSWSKVGVWYADSVRRIIGSISLYDRANSKRYVNNILVSQYSYFQQDNATAGTLQHFMETDFGVCDFYK
jgi:hypothetical protein